MRSDADGLRTFRDGVDITIYSPELEAVYHDLCAIQAVRLLLDEGYVIAKDAGEWSVCSVCCGEISLSVGDSKASLDEALRAAVAGVLDNRKDKA